MNAYHPKKGAYLDEFFACIGKEKSQLLLGKTRTLGTSHTRAFRHDIQQQRPFRLADLDSLLHCKDSTVLVIENIGLEWISALGESFDISPAFFAEHATNPPGQSPWKAIIGQWSADQRKPVQNGGGDISAQRRKCWHVDGVIEFISHKSGPKLHAALSDPNFLPRHVAHDTEFGLQATSRTSYCLVNPNLYLFLVDAPIQPPITVRSNMTTQLRLPLALNRGGVVLPQLLGHSEPWLFGCLHSFFSHPWHFHVLFIKSLDESVPLSPETIFHLLVSSTWNTNLQSLERNIQRISFEDIRRPSIAINDELHDHRRDLWNLRSQVTRTIKWMPPSVKQELEDIKDSLPASKYFGYPDVILKDTLDGAVSLEEFLVNTFNLLLSSIGVMEAEASKAQNRRAQMLTQLAFIYVPLSFVTGIFGMNIKEINGSLLSVWVSIVVLIVTGVCTVAVFAIFSWWQDSNARKWWSSQSLPNAKAK